MVGTMEYIGFIGIYLISSTLFSLSFIIYIHLTEETKLDVNKLKALKLWTTAVILWSTPLMVTYYLFEDIFKNLKRNRYDSIKVFVLMLSIVFVLGYLVGSL